MFTGIVQKISTVEKISERGGSFSVFIKIPKGWKIRKGESIAVNGICSTVRNIFKNIFEVEYMPETIGKTTAGNFNNGTIVNLEKSLKASDLLGGHIVQGHVDAAGKIIDIRKAKEPARNASQFEKIQENKNKPESKKESTNFQRHGEAGGSKILKVKIPKEFMKFVAEKGSIAIDGISLTVVKAGVDWFTVSLVSYTLENTNLGQVAVGDYVNVETDVLAKYLNKLLKAK